MKCLLWNLEWAKPSSKRGRRIGEIIASTAPDTICLTETTQGMVPAGCSIESQSDYGYPNKNGTRRKIVLWSRSPWSEVDAVGSSDLPPGRFVTGVTEGIRFVGVCIPWQSAHVTSGTRDRKLWQDHLQYLEGLRPLLARYAAEQLPVCVLGDFNQRIPAFRQPSRVGDILLTTLGENYRVSTGRFTDSDGCALIDLVSPTKDLCVSVKSLLPKREESGLKLSDHAGLVLDIVLSNEQHFPEGNIRDLMTAAALRFNGYAFAESRSENGDVFDVLSKLAEQVVETQRPLLNDLENFAACFALQRFLCKWGGDRLTWESPEWHAFARLFIHLNNKETPPDYLDAERETKWKLVASDSENAVALLRKKLE